MNYHHLYYFKVIAEEGTVSAAAKKLRLGQPTLSAQLRQLEDAIGVRLFERKHKRLILTEHGRIALEYAKSIFTMGAEMIEAINDRVRPSKTSLCIGALDSIPKQVIQALTLQALAIQPCQVTLVEGRPEEMLRELSAHRVDLLLTNFIPTALHAKGLFHRLIAREAVGVFGAPKFKGLRSNFPSSISGQPMILPTYDSRLRYNLDHWIQTVGVELDILVESQDIAIKKMMAIDGLGLLPAAAYSVNRQVRKGELVRIGILDGIYEELYLVSASRKVANPIAKVLMGTFQI